MARIAPAVPAETDLLCERCGYVLNGLPDGSRCPECGTPVSESVNDRRQPTAFERSAGVARVPAFFVTTAALLFTPTRFFRTLAARHEGRPARTFGGVHWVIASMLFAAAAYLHARWFLGLSGKTPAWLAWWSVWPVLVALTFALLVGLNRLAARLTNWEATYRGYRLAVPVVMRALHYHAAHYFVVGVIAVVTIGGYQWLVARGTLGFDTANKYLYTLCGEVIVAAGYLFETYWIGMRNLMYANR